MKNKKQNLTEGAGVLLLSTLAVKLIGALFKIPLSADYALSDLGFGYFSAVYDMYIPIYTLALSGIPIAISRIIADFVAKKQEENAYGIFRIALKSMIIIGTLGSFMLLVLSLPLVSLIDKSENSIYCLWVLAPSVFFCAVVSVIRGYFEGVKNMIPTAVSSLIEALSKLVLGLSGAIITIRLTHNFAYAAAAAMGGITFGTVLSCLYLVYAYKRNNSFVMFKGTKIIGQSDKLFGQLIRLCLPVVIASLSVGIVALIDSLTLRIQLSSLITQNPQNAELLLRDTMYKNIPDFEIPTLLYGVKGKVFTLFNLIPTITTTLSVAAMPILTESYVKNYKNQLSENLNLLIKYSSLIAFPAGLGFSFIGKEIMQLLYGEVSCDLGGKLLLFYGLAGIFAGLSVPLTTILQAKGQQGRALLSIAWGLLLKLVTSLLLVRIPSVNIYGAGISTAFCFGLIFLLQLILLWRDLRDNIAIVNCIFKPFTIAIISCVAAYLTVKLIDSSVGCILGIGIAALIYVAFLFVFRVINIKELLGFIKNE